jgi:hypothetical protein
MEGKGQIHASMTFKEQRYDHRPDCRNRRRDSRNRDRNRHPNRTLTSHSPQDLEKTQ